MAISLEMTQKITEWRRKALAGELTKEECMEAIRALRSDRVAASHASTTSRTKKADSRAPVDTSALLAGLLGGQGPGEKL